MHTRTAEAGFSLVDMLVTVAIVGIVAAMAVPILSDMVNSMRLGQGAREVMQELQAARLKAVTSNRPIRVRFNCPAARQYRTVELIGTTSTPAAADTAANRCQEAVYPATPDTNPLTRPNHDAPTRTLPTGVSFGATTTLEFWPDGSVHSEQDGSLPWRTLPGSGTAITVTKGGSVKAITVNGVGRILN